MIQIARPTAGLLAVLSGRGTARQGPVAAHNRESRLLAAAARLAPPRAGKLGPGAGFSPLAAVFSQYAR